MVTSLKLQSNNSLLICKMDNNAFTILIIEDEPDISELIEYNLTQSGYSILVSNNGENEVLKKNSEKWKIMLEKKFNNGQGFDTDNILFQLQKNN